MHNSKVEFLLVTSFLLVTNFVILSSDPLKGVRVRHERLFCTCGKYCTFKVCNVKLKARDVACVNMLFTANKKLDDIKFTMKTYYKYSNNEYRPTLIHGNVDFCAVQDGLYNSPLFTYVKNVFGNTSNIFIQKCPLLPGEYYVMDFNLQARHLISIIPHGQYIINYTVYAQSDEWLFNLSSYISVVNYGMQDWTIGGR